MSKYKRNKFLILKTKDMNMTLLQMIDIITAVLLMGSFLYASLKKEKLNESIQLNTINVVVGTVSTIIAFKAGIIGIACRQTFFIIVSSYNLITFYKNRQ